MIDGERAVRRLLRAVLEPRGYRVVQAENGRDALTQVIECEPDVIIMEMLLPDVDGLSVLRSLQEWEHIPVLVLSQQAQAEAKVAALDAGARDYLTKPFSSDELLARLRVLQRPLPNVPDGPLLIEGDLVANLATHEVSFRQRPIALTRKETALFYVLARYAGRVVTRTHLLRSVWGARSEEKTQDLIVLVAHLRKKLGLYGGELLIKTQGSIGYSLSLDVQTSSPAEV